ncbi:MAG: NHLP-related RiPP peptide [Lysobacter sp.]
MPIKKTAESKTTAGKKSAPLDPKMADKLLGLLSTDNEFRRLFKRDPQAALATVGYSDPSMSTCCSVQAIAPKREIIAAREQLKAHLASAGLFRNPHCFEAGKVTRTLRRV